MPGLADQLREALQAFAPCEQPPALIGGLVLVAHQVIRTTLDFDSTDLLRELMRELET